MKEPIREPNGKGHNIYGFYKTQGKKDFMFKKLKEKYREETQEAWHNGVIPTILEALSNYRKSRVDDLLTIGVDKLEYCQGVIEGLDRIIKAIGETQKQEVIENE